MNLSMRQLQDGQLLNVLTAALKDSGLLKPTGWYWRLPSRCSPSTPTAPPVCSSS
ncbi:MAG: hypothetical protein R2713_09705 [Ilumatobacteraceae bacterium]